MQAGRRNVEVKLRVSWDEEIAHRLQVELGAQDRGILVQEDIFFVVPRGRLKLRLQNGRAAQLIAYARTDRAALRASEYRIVECDDGNGLRHLLAEALGEWGVVRKRRRLLLLENVRVHLDEVEGLGRFVEIEAVVDATHDEATCTKAARHLLRDLGLEQAPAESRAYIDLLQTRGVASPTPRAPGP